MEPEEPEGERPMELDEAAVLGAARAGALDELRGMLTDNQVLVLRAADVDGRTAFYLACWAGHAEVVSFLLGVPGVDINRAKSTGATPLNVASQNGHARVIDLLLSAPGIEVNRATKFGATPLFIASQNGHAAVVDLLLSARGIEVNCQISTTGTTPLFVASYNGHAAVVKLLLSAPGLEIDAARHSGATPLMIAAHRGHAAIAFSLVGRGARTHDVPDVPAAGQPEVHSREVGHAAIADYLRDVRAAGGIAKYRSEPRLQLLLLRALCSQGRASVIDDRAEEDVAATAAVEPHHHAKRRRLVEWLFGATPRPAARDDGGDDDGGGARAAPAPRLTGMPGGTESGPLRVVLEYWWSP